MAPGIPGMAEVAAWPVWLRVLDEGSGIPDGELEHIFDKFYRAQKADQVRAGTGLGLAISRKLARMMGGDVIVASEPGKGSVFTVRLPSSASH